MRRCLKLFFLAAWACIACAPAAQAESQPSEADLKKLKSAIKQVQHQLRSYQSKEFKLRDNLRDAEVTIGAVQSRIRKVQQQLKTQQTKLRELEQKRQQLQSLKTKQEQRIGEHIAAAYRLGRQKKLKVLLNQEEPEKLSRTLAYYDYFNRARQENIQQYQHTLDELDSIEPQIRATAEALANSKTTLIEERDQLRSQQAQRQQALATIKAAIKDQSSQLTQLSREQKELEKLLSAMEETIANIKLPSDYKPFKELRGKLRWPTKGRMLNRFGQLRPNGQMRWQGVTIAGREGAAVKAIHRGRVVFADWFVGKGLLIIVDHGDGYMSLYAHNQSLLKEPGEWVNTGETIATVGNSGGLHTASLYFEIRSHGKPQNPRRWCRG